MIPSTAVRALPIPEPSLDRGENEDSEQALVPGANPGGGHCQLVTGGIWGESLGAVASVTAGGCCSQGEVGPGVLS